MTALKCSDGSLNEIPSRFTALKKFGLFTIRTFLSVYTLNINIYGNTILLSILNRHKPTYIHFTYNVFCIPFFYTFKKNPILHTYIWEKFDAYIRTNVIA